jgi:hypothetical protein
MGKILECTAYLETYAINGDGITELGQRIVQVAVGPRDVETDRLQPSDD